MGVHVITDFCRASQAGKSAPFDTRVFTVSANPEWFELCTQFHDKVWPHTWCMYVTVVNFLHDFKRKLFCEICNAMKFVVRVVMLINGRMTYILSLSLSYSQSGVGESMLPVAPETS